MRFLLLLLTSICTATLSQALTTIELSGGSAVRGEILSEKTDRIVIDLGITVLTIPRDSIHAITHADTDDAANVEQTSIFRFGSNGKTLSVKDWVDEQGEAVVLVRTGTGLGSGFVIHQDGYVVTNDHVIAGEHAVSVTVFEKDENGLKRSVFENVEILASSSQNDLALLKIKPETPREFVSVSLGSSADLKQGQTVFAIGSPLGLERSVSQGIISLKNRLIGGNIYIQTTTEINPGNSGGPLFNLQGEVVGVNNMKIVAMGAEGLGFAIPSSVLEMFLRNRDAFLFDPRNPNAGFLYNEPPRQVVKERVESTESE